MGKGAIQAGFMRLDLNRPLAYHPLMTTPDPGFEGLEKQLPDGMDF